MKADFSDVIARSDSLLKKAEVVLKQKLSSNQDDENLLWQLAEIFRQRGEIDKALDCYQKLLSLKPNHQQAKLLSAIFREKPVHDLFSDNVQPAAYVRIDDFLTQEKCQKIWDIIKQKNDAFSDSTIAKRVDPSYRNSHLLYEDDLGEISGWFLKKIYGQLAEVWPRLPVEPFIPVRKELQLTMHQDGEFYKIHTDDEKTGKSSTREITFVYYFHQTPKRYSGGDLLLFDTDSKRDLCINKYTRFSPKHNCILFFPSHIYHQVTTVNCASQNIEHGRFTLNGWLHKE